MSDANSRREQAEKAVERLRVELINKSRESDELKKENRRMRHEMEARGR